MKLKLLKAKISQFFRLVLLVDMPTPWWLWIELMFADRLEQVKLSSLNLSGRVLMGSNN